MRITEILTESQLEQLDEGPILNKIGTGVANVVGGVAKGVGAVAGGVAGLGSAFKKGFDRSKGIVSQGGDYVAPPDAPAPPKAGTPAPQPQDRIDPTMDEPAAAAPEAPGAAAAPAAASGDAGLSTTTPPSAAEINAQGPKGTAPAKAQTGDAGKALAKSTAVVDKQQAVSQQKANQTVYAQIKANVDKLDKKGKQEILQLLQKSMSAAAPAKPGAAPAAGAGAMGQMANTLAGGKPNTMANAPVSKTNTAKPGNPNAAPAADPATTAAPTATKAKGGKVAGQVSQTPGAVRKRNARATAKSANSAGAAAMGGMANQLTKQNASKNNYGNALSEALAQRVETHKQKMFETGLAQGTISVFRK